VAQTVLVVLVQTSVVILLAALTGRAVFGQRAEARHGLWLGALIWVLISPALAVIADHSGLSLWVVALPVTGYGVTSTDDEVVGERGPSHAGPRSDSSRLAAELPNGSVAAETVPPHEAIAVTPVEPAQFEAAHLITPESNRRKSAVMGGLTLLWAAGVLVGLIRMAVGWRRLTALSQAALPLDRVRHGSALERARDALGVATLPPIVTSPTVRGPVAVGLCSSRVVLPEGLAEAIASDSLRDVLVHECAHVVRLDAWVGLLQRLAGALFWPHPLVHYLNSQLKRAREEVCDNHVLRCADPRGYARTLLALTEQCLPLGAARPGLALLGARWTLADRVAGLLDPRRIAVTRMTIRTKIAVWVALAVTALAAASVRLDRSARADGPQAKPTEPRAAAAPAVWSVEGTVVHERGRPVAGAVVRAVPYDGAVDGHKTAADGTFAVPLGGRRSYIRGVVAETDGAARIGLVRFEDVRRLTEKDPLKIALKPSRPVKVRVNDAAGSPVPGAAVEAIDPSFRTHATTGPEGAATLQVPADAKVQWVIGLKAGAGFDYFENYRTEPAADFPLLPADVSLTLDGAQTVRVKAVDSKGQSVSGVEIGPALLSKIGKVSSANALLSAIAKATTDRQGVATFDWLPKGGADVEFQIARGGNYSCPHLPLYEPAGPAELTAHVFRETRLSGTVRFPDGRPAAGLLIRAEGHSPGAGRAYIAARTLADGSYVLGVPPQMSYVVTVIDETWAAPSLSNVIVREGREQGRLDLTLTKGTLLHGRVSEAPDRRPSAGAEVRLTEEGGLLPKELRQGGFGTARLIRSSTADADGRYHFRVGPGRYSLRSPNAGGSEPLKVEVKQEAEIVRDLALKGPARETYFSGVIIEKTPTGDRPVARATVHRLRAGFDGTYNSSRADDEGRFRMLRTPGEWILYATSPERSLAGLMPPPAEVDNVRFVISKAPRLTGRVIDANGTPQAARNVGVRIDSGPDFARAGHLGFGIRTDDQGRFTVTTAPVGSQGELSVFHQKNVTWSTPRTVVRFAVSDTDPVEIPDLVVPVEKPTK